MSFQRLKSSDRDGGEAGTSSSDKQMRRQITNTKKDRTWAILYVVLALAMLAGLVTIAAFVGVTYTNSKTLVDRPPPVLHCPPAQPCNCGAQSKDDITDNDNPQNCRGKTIRVHPTGRIQDGIDRACPGDTVLVSPGTYHECLEIPQTKHNLVLRADGPPGSVVINGNFSGTRCRIVILAGNIERINQFAASAQPQVPFGFPRQSGRGPIPYSPNWLSVIGGGGFDDRWWCPGDPNWPAADLPGQTLHNVMLANGSFYETYVVPPYNGAQFTPWERGPHNLTIHGFEIVGSSFTGVYISAGDSYNIEGNHIHNVGVYGTFPVCSSYGVTRNNVIHNVTDAGIYNGDDLGGWVVGNEVYHCLFGVEKEATDNGLVEYNYFHDNSIGILCQYLPWLPRSSVNGQLIRHNRIENNNLARVVTQGGTTPSTAEDAPYQGIGIWMLGAQDSTISDNEVTGHGNFGVLVSDQNRAWYIPLCDVTDYATAYGPRVARMMCGVGNENLTSCSCPLNDFGFPVPPGVTLPATYTIPEIGVTVPAFNVLEPPVCQPGGAEISSVTGKPDLTKAPDCGYNHDLYARNIQLRNNVMSDNGDDPVSPFDVFGIGWAGTATTPGGIHGYDVFIASNLRRDVSKSAPHGKTTVCVDTSNLLQSTNKGAYAYYLASLRQFLPVWYVPELSWPMLFDRTTWPILSIAQEATCSSSGQLPQSVATEYSNFYTPGVYGADANAEYGNTRFGLFDAFNAAATASQHGQTTSKPTPKPHAVPAWK